MAGGLNICAQYANNFSIEIVLALKPFDLSLLTQRLPLFLVYLFEEKVGQEKDRKENIFFFFAFKLPFLI